MIAKIDFNPNLYHYRLGDNLLTGLSIKEQLEKITVFTQRMCNSENIHFFIGSGCSLPAVPLMAWTFQKLKKETLNEDALGEYVGENPDIENYLNWLKNAISFLGESDEGIKFKIAFDQTKLGLIESMPKKYTQDVNDDIKTTLNNYKQFYATIFLQREFKKLSPVNIFTTNYDLFNEISMEQLGIQYTNGFRGSVNRIFDPSVFRLRLVDDENRYKDKWNVIRRYVKLYKIHGSIDWKYNNSIKSIVQSNINKTDDEIMIYPTINKHLETQQSPYSELFRELTINLQKKNSTLIVMGYGFPDTHINQLIAQALNNEDFTLVVFGNIEEPAALDFYNLHKERKNFHFIGGDLTNKADGHHFNNIIRYLSGGDENI